MFRKLLLWLIHKEIKKDDLRKDDSFFGDICNVTFNEKFNEFNEDTAYGIFYMIYRSMLNGIKVKGFKQVNGKLVEGEFPIKNLAMKPLLSGIRSETIAYFEEVNWFDEDGYKIAEAKYCLTEVL